MKFLIQYRLKNSLTENITTCSTELQALTFAKNIKAMGCEYCYINKIVYDMELTLKA